MKAKRWHECYQAAEERSVEMVLASKNPALTPAVMKMDLVKAMLVKMAIRVSSIMSGSKDPGWKYVCLEHWVLAHGKAYPARTRPDGVRPGPIKQCFANSTKALVRVRPPKLRRYVEGYYLRMIDAQHAWNLDEAGQVVDLTIRKHSPDDDILATQYFGVEFNRDWVLETTCRREYYGVLDDWQANYPLLHDDSLLKEALP